jgi:ornithine carbamoyltransferase
MNFLDVDDLTTAQLDSVLATASDLKAADDGDTLDSPLDGRSLAMLFEKPSTRTRLSFEVGMTKLGGHAVYLGKDDIHLGHGEPVKDTARAIACYADAIMARVDEHATLETLAEYATVPVINALSEKAHPVQTLADLLTIRETAGADASVAWVGAGNNVAASFAIGAAMQGLDLTVATPAGYGLTEGVLARAREHGTVETTTDPADAIADADVVYTDVWVSMGQEAEREVRLEAFRDYQLNDALLADSDALVMHCLPAHRDEEITDAVIESDRSVVWQQAENRMWGQNGLLLELLAGDLA